MTRFNSKIGAAVLLGLAAVYLVIALATGHSAASQPPADLDAKGAALDVWRALALLTRAPDEVAVLDVRPAERYRVYHLPLATNLPAAGPSRLARRAGGKRAILLVADKDAAAARLAGQLRRGAPEVAVHYLAGGARAWYLALELPVLLFRDKPPPFGYAEAIEQVRGWLRAPAKPGGAALQRAIGKLASLDVQPTLLAGKKKPKAGKKKKKKISGGCG